MTWRLDYYYDGELIGDIFEITQEGFAGGVSRNGVGAFSFKLSLLKLAEWCAGKNFDVQRFFTPQKSSCIATQLTINPDTEVVEVGESLGGWLDATPEFTFGASVDAIVPFTFVGWIGLSAGYFIKPPLSYNDNFNDVAEQQINLAIEKTFLEGSMWPITVGESDVLPVVSDTLEAPKSLKDFLLERTDNTTGTGNFDVYADPRGVFSLHIKYGEDLTLGDNPVTFTYPDKGGKYDLKEIPFPRWDNYASHVFLTGAGNGYRATSGAQGAAIFTTAKNLDTIANTGYWEIATSESDIKNQTVLNQKATSYVKDTDKPFSTPSLKLDGDKFKIYSHDQGGELWLGDVINVDAVAWVKPLLPLQLPLKLRINSLDISVNKLHHCDLSLGMVADG